jgi:hypothetical protein
VSQIVSSFTHGPRFVRSSSPTWISGRFEGVRVRIEREKMEEFSNKKASSKPVLSLQKRGEIETGVKSSSPNIN